MSEQSAVVEATPTEVMDVSRGPLVNITPEQRAEFRLTGTLPEPPKKEEAAASSEPTPEQAEAKPAGDSEPPKAQEKPTKPKQTAEERIAQLEATIEKIRKGAGKETPKAAESSPAKPEPRPVEQFTRPKPTANDKDKDGNPKYAEYEDFVEDLSDWKTEQRLAAREREQAEQALAKDFATKMAEAESRYENFTEIADPFAGEILGDAAISPVVKQMFRDSDVMPDLVFTIASNAKDRADFIKMAKEQPGKAIRYIALTESLITDQLEGKTTPAEESPVKPKTQAPKPPAEVGGRAASPGDPLESAAKANDYRAFKAEANRRELARIKG